MGLMSSLLLSSLSNQNIKTKTSFLGNNKMILSLKCSSSSNLYVQGLIMEKALIQSKTLSCCISLCIFIILFAIVFNVRDIFLNPLYWSWYVYTA